MAKQKRTATSAPSSGDVFADLELDDAVTLDTKLRLAIEMHRVLSTRTFSPVPTARLLGVRQAQTSARQSFRLGGFSVVRLTQFLTARSRDVETGSAAAAITRVGGLFRSRSHNPPALPPIPSVPTRILHPCNAPTAPVPVTLAFVPSARH